MCDIDGDHRVGVKIGSDHFGAFEAEFLLDGRDRVERDVDVPLDSPAQGLGGDPDAGPVVDPSPGDPTICQVVESHGWNRRIADFNEVTGCFLVFGPDVDVLGGDVGDRFLVAVISQVDRRLGDDAVDRAGGGLDLDLGPRETVASEPPTGMILRKPSSVIAETAYPISSAWPVTAIERSPDPSWVATALP
jgi:hypothetical protein